MQRRKEIVKGKGLSLEVAHDEELSDGGYSPIEEFQDKETLPHRHRIKRNRFREPYLVYLNIHIKSLHIIQWEN